jgi:hypothetical protein
MMPPRRARVAGMLAVIAAGVLGTGFSVVASLAAASIPVPVITGAPANPTTSSSAIFTFTDAQAGATFRCSPDSASFTACTSGITYGGLSPGSHAFRVEAVSGSGTSSPASYTWRVDTTAPAITVTFPDAGGSYGQAAWSSGCAPAAAGICGAAADPSGVASVAVGIYQQSSGKYWDGSSFSAPSLVFSAASGTTAWRYGFTPPLDGGYAVYVRAADGLGNSTSTAGLAAAGFTYRTGPHTFTVGGDLPSPLYPGTSLPLNLTFTNPAASPVTIPSGGVSAGNITITSSARGCASSNFAVARPLAASVTIPARQAAPISLSALGVPPASWPAIKMIETHTNQDACQGASLTLTYSGIEAT